MQAVVDSLLTNYRKTGQGKVVVMLHGWASDSTTFGELATRLNSKYAVLALDLPGFGGSEAPPEVWRLENYAGFLAKWLKKIGAGEVYGLVGHSFGGSVAITALASDKLKAKKLILLSSAGVRNKQKLRKSSLAAVAKTGKAVTFWLPESTRQKLRRGFYARTGSDALLKPELEQSFRAMMKQDVQSLAARVKTPTLLIYGQADQQTPLKDAQALHHAIKSSKLEVLPGLDHFAHRDQPDQVAQLVMDFLSEAKK